jgi:hypothetical protein
MTTPSLGPDDATSTGPSRGSGPRTSRWASQAPIWGFVLGWGSPGRDAVLMVLDNG